MLRIILRNTHNALLFACTLLLLCSLERLWRYDFARGAETDEHAAAADLQVDHFVPAWESTRGEAKNNPVSTGLFKFMTFSSSSTAWAAARTFSSTPAPVLVVPKGQGRKDRVTAESTSTTLATEEETTTPTPLAATTTTEENLMLSASPKTLEESKIILRRQIRQRKRSHPTTTSRYSEEQLHLQGQGHDTSAQRKQQPPHPTIGFVLHLPSCDKGAVAKWQTVWHEQAIDQPFLFHVLLGSAVDKSCLVDLQSDLLVNNNNNNNNDDTILYQVSQNEQLALTLQTCQSPQTNVLPLLQLEQVLYYDATKAQGRLRSSAVLRRFLAPSVRSSVFACTGGGQHKPVFCDDSVLECPWFQYSPVVTPTEESAADGLLFTTPQKLEMAVE